MRRVLDLELILVFFLVWSCLVLLFNIPPWFSFLVGIPIGTQIPAMSGWLMRKCKEV